MTLFCRISWFEDSHAGDVSTRIITIAKLCRSNEFSKRHLAIKVAYQNQDAVLLPDLANHPTSVCQCERCGC